MNSMPKWNELFLPSLEFYAKRSCYNNRQAKSEIADSLSLSDELRREKYSQTGYNKIENRIGWAISALKIAGLLEQVKTGDNKITELGEQLLISRNGKNFNERFLYDNYPLYREHTDGIKNSAKLKKDGVEDLNERVKDLKPEELIDDAMKESQAGLAAQLLAKVREMNPYDFEETISELFKKMGYGDTQITKKSGDGGVDVIIDEDALGLNKVYIQVKRYGEGNIINEKAIRDFLGSLSANNIAKGIFITASSFSNSARELAQNKSIILLNGGQIASLMIRHNIGVSISHTYEIKKIDTDYFGEGDES